MALLCLDCLINTFEKTLNDAISTNQFQHISLHELKCSCGEVFVKMSDASQLYDGSGVWCDLCNVEGRKNDIFWHCVGDKNKMHPHGYDVCNDCYYTPNLTLQETKTEPTDVFLHRNDPLDELIELKSALDQYYSSSENELAEQYPIEVVVNDFTYLLNNFTNDDYKFENIYDYLGGECNINRCQLFRRNYRNRENTIQHNHEKLITLKDECVEQIMDKIHCFWMHSFDMGNRLTAKEKSYINSNDSKQDNEDELLMDKKIQQIVNLSRTKRSAVEPELINISSSKYNALEIYKTTTHSKNMYSFGTVFRYKYDDKKESKIDGLQKFVAQYGNPDDAISVRGKFPSLKEELIGNSVSTININQFNLEYKKTNIYYNSHYCKKKYRPFEWEDLGVYIHDIPFDCLLSLVIYCNYDMLQMKLSSTYRNIDTETHDEFYNMGKYLSLAVNGFGDSDRGISINKVNVKQFYHGVGEKLRLKHYGIKWGISLNGPVSTSSSFEVATHFTNDCKGLVIVFGNNDSGEPSCFDVSWLSDYPSEKEYLFLQMNGFLRTNIAITDIIDVEIGIRYSIILKALEGISNKNVDDYVSLLAKRLIQNQIVGLRDYEPFESLSEYGHHICHTYFSKQKHIWLDCAESFIRNGFIRNLLFHYNYKCVDLNVLKLLYPNLEIIDIVGIEADENAMQCCLNFMSEDTTNVEQINLRRLGIGFVNIWEVLHKWTEQFTFENGRIYYREFDDQLIVAKLQIIDYILKILNYFGDEIIYFDDINNNVQQLLTKLLCSPRNNDVTDSVDPIQTTFIQRCQKTFALTWNWNKMIDESVLPCISRWFLNEQLDWLDIANITSLYPNLSSVTLENVKFSEIIIKDILLHIDDDATKLNDIGLHVYVEKEIVAEIVSKYTQIFINIEHTFSTCREHWIVRFKKK
eukprot:20427_1